MSRVTSREMMAVESFRQTCMCISGGWPLLLPLVASTTFHFTELVIPEISEGPIFDEHLPTRVMSTVRILLLTT